MFESADAEVDLLAWPEEWPDHQWPEPAANLAVGSDSSAWPDDLTGVWPFDDPAGAAPVGESSGAGGVSAAEWLRSLVPLSPAERLCNAVMGIDPSSLDDAGRTDLLQILDQQRNWLDAGVNRVLNVIERTDETELHLTQEAVSLALRIAPRTAMSKLKVARRLADDLPAVAGLLEQGRVTGRQAEVIAERSWQLPDELLPAYEARMTLFAPRQRLTSTQRMAGKALLELDPAGAEKRVQAAKKTRAVTIRPVEDGMVELTARLTAGDGLEVFTRLSTAAAGLPKHDAPPTDTRDARPAAAGPDAQPTDAQVARPAAAGQDESPIAGGQDAQPTSAERHGPSIDAERTGPNGAEQDGPTQDGGRPDSVGAERTGSNRAERIGLIGAEQGGPPVEAKQGGAPGGAVDAARSMDQKRADLLVEAIVGLRP